MKEMILTLLLIKLHIVLWFFVIWLTLEVFSDNKTKKVVRKKSAFFEVQCINRKYFIYTGDSFIPNKNNPRETMKFNKIGVFVGGKFVRMKLGDRQVIGGFLVVRTG